LSTDFGVCSENTVFRAVFKWWDAHKDADKGQDKELKVCGNKTLEAQTLVKLLSNVRFSQLSENFLLDIVPRVVAEASTDPLVIDFVKTETNDAYRFKALSGPRRQELIVNHMKYQTRRNGKYGYTPRELQITNLLNLTPNLTDGTLPQLTISSQPILVDGFELKVHARVLADKSIYLAFGSSNPLRNPQPGEGVMTELNLRVYDYKSQEWVHLTEIKSFVKYGFTSSVLFPGKPSPTSLASLETNQYFSPLFDGSMRFRFFGHMS
jgi:hypothetical protein